MHAHGVDVFDEADGNHLVLRVADDLDFKLFPTEHGFLDQALVGERRLQAALNDGAQLLNIVDEPAAGAAHGVSRTHHHGISERRRDLFGVLDGVGDLTLGHFDAQARHRVLEDLAVFAALDGV